MRASSYAKEKIFIALVTFERTDQNSDVLEPTDHGAVGWMGAKSRHADEVATVIGREIADCGLNRIEIEDITEIDSLDEVGGFDEHLECNMWQWKKGKKSVWGTLHVYLADGEA